MISLLDKDFFLRRKFGMFQQICCLFIAFVLLFSCQGRSQGNNQSETTATGGKKMEIKITSKAFLDAELDLKAGVKKKNCLKQ